MTTCAASALKSLWLNLLHVHSCRGYAAGYIYGGTHWLGAFGRRVVFVSEAPLMAPLSCLPSNAPPFLSRRNIRSRKMQRMR
jgi:hypothetical protein